MKQRYLTPTVSTHFMHMGDSILGSASIPVTNNNGNYEKDDEGNNVINAKPHSLQEWWEDEEQ